MPHAPSQKTVRKVERRRRENPQFQLARALLVLLFLPLIMVSTDGSTTHYDTKVVERDHWIEKGHYDYKSYGEKRHAQGVSALPLAQSKKLEISSRGDKPTEDEVYEGAEPLSTAPPTVEKRQFHQFTRLDIVPRAPQHIVVITRGATDERDESLTTTATPATLASRSGAQGSVGRNAVPEPAVGALVVLAACTLSAVRRRDRRPA